jgi:glutamine amidotransferase
MIAIIDYGVGNLFSIRRSLNHLGFDGVVTGEADAVARADKLILPGVGAFGDAMAKLRATDLIGPLTARVQSGAPLLGICLGMQLLFDESFEYGRHAGLSLIPGRIVPFRGAVPDQLKVPQIGWNALTVRRASPLLRDIKDGDCVYYVHSYYADTDEQYVAASSEYAIDVPGVVQHKNVFGCQFHPEKSGSVGLKILRAFAEMA